MTPFERKEIHDLEVELLKRRGAILAKEFDRCPKCFGQIFDNGKCYACNQEKPPESKRMQKMRELGLISKWNDQNGWIKCSEKTPPEDIWILGANCKRVEMGVYLGKVKGFTLPQCNYMCLEITHWMPLPEPPND